MLMKKNSSPIKLIDAYSGAGGMTLGFTKLCDNRIVPIWANDVNKCAVHTYNTNFGKHCVLGDIEILLEDPGVDIPEADVVIGGPPCQGFSLLNKRRTETPESVSGAPSST